MGKIKHICIAFLTWLGILPKPHRIEIRLFWSLKGLIKLASENGFVITEKSVYDCKDCYTVEIDVAEARRHFLISHSNVNTLSSETSEKMIFNRALRTALNKQPRLVILSLTNKPDLSLAASV